jgi:hypothetical protein
MLQRVVLIRTDVSEKHIASIIRVIRIGELVTTIAVTSKRSTLVFFRSAFHFLITADVFPSSTILFTLMMEAILSFETPVHTRVTRRNIPEDGIHFCECVRNSLILTKMK